jgi:hypothetical protein
MVLDETAASGATGALPRDGATSPADPGAPRMLDQHFIAVKVDVDSRP